MPLKAFDYLLLQHCVGGVGDFRRDFFLSWKTNLIVYWKKVWLKYNVDQKCKFYKILQNQHSSPPPPLHAMATASNCRLRVARWHVGTPTRVNKLSSGMPGRAKYFTNLAKSRVTFPNKQLATLHHFQTQSRGAYTHSCLLNATQLLLVKLLRRSYACRLRWLSSKHMSIRVHLPNKRGTSQILHK